MCVVVVVFGMVAVVVVGVGVVRVCVVWFVFV